MKENNQIVAAIMCVRNEESIIDLNISYHLDLGFDYLFIMDHCSTDSTSRILEEYKNDDRVVVINERDPIFDHAKLSNSLINYANKYYQIDWFVFLDVDEFLSLKDEKIHNFISRLERNNIIYATVGWVNALFDHTYSDYRCSPVYAIDTTKYYRPWPERSWQQHGHFRKAIVKNHRNIEVVAGGHYVRSENNVDFFKEYHWNPFIIPEEEAKILHFEFRERGDVLYRKWKTLALYENDSTSSADAPWLERIERIKFYVEKFEDNINLISKKWFCEHRSFWGTLIPADRIVYDTTISYWYRKYFRRKIESGRIKSICLARKGHLGDVIMTEPIARFLSKYVNKIYLLTDVKGVADILSTFDQIYDYNQFKNREVVSDFTIPLIYELSNNQKSYIQGFMESVGFDDVENLEVPIIKDDWEKLIDEEYILIAPFTSLWEEGKRSWGYEKFVELSKSLEKELGFRCVILENEYSFLEMMSLIKHCRIFIGNDSGPSVIAQSYNKKSFVIFGGTSPKYIHLSGNCIPIYDRNKHSMCCHISRQEEIDCCEEFIMLKLSVNNVLNQIKDNL